MMGRRVAQGSLFYDFKLDDHMPADNLLRRVNGLLDLDIDCILDVEATPARFSAEVAATRTLIAQVKAKLGMPPASIGADEAYGNGPVLGWLVGQNITPHVLVIDRTRQRDGFFSPATPSATTATPTRTAAWPISR